jgi:uncharacterized protein (DUF952 family)
VCEHPNPGKSNPNIGIIACTLKGRYGRVGRKGDAVATIYKICGRPEWQVAERNGEYRGSEVDTNDGFIHFSSATQTVETAEKHFSGQQDLMLIAVDAAALGAALKWEPSRGGALFPHLYGPLPLAAVRWAKPLPDESGGKRQFPELEP